MDYDERKRCFYDAAQHAASFAKTHMRIVDIQEAHEDAKRRNAPGKNVVPWYCAPFLPSHGIPPLWYAFARNRSRCALFKAGMLGDRRADVHFEDALEVVRFVVEGATARRMPKRQSAARFEDVPLSPASFKAAQKEREPIVVPLEECSVGALGVRKYRADIQELRDIGRPFSLRPFKQRQVLSGRL